MCRKVKLDDLAYLLEVAAAEASKARAPSRTVTGPVHSAVHQLSAQSS
jgi:hypothetical protein